MDIQPIISVEETVKNNRKITDFAPKQTTVQIIGRDIHDTLTGLYEVWCEQKNHHLTCYKRCPASKDTGNFQFQKNKTISFQNLKKNHNLRGRTQPNNSYKRK